MILWYTLVSLLLRHSYPFNYLTRWGLGQEDYLLLLRLWLIVLIWMIYIKIDCTLPWLCRVFFRMERTIHVSRIHFAYIVMSANRRNGSERSPVCVAPCMPSGPEFQGSVQHMRVSSQSHERPSFTANLSEILASFSVFAPLLGSTL